MPRSKPKAQWSGVWRGARITLDANTRAEAINILNLEPEDEASAIEEIEKALGHYKEAIGPLNKKPRAIDVMVNAKKIAEATEDLQRTLEGLDLMSTWALEGDFVQLFDDPELAELIQGAGFLEDGELRRIKECLWRLSGACELVRRRTEGKESRGQSRDRARNFVVACLCRTFGRRFVASDQDTPREARHDFVGLLLTAAKIPVPWGEQKGAKKIKEMLAKYPEDWCKPGVRPKGT